MAGLLTAWVIARRRVRANVRLTAALVLGVVVAASLLASTSIYARAMADLGLTYQLRNRLPVAPVTTVLTYEQGYPIGSDDARFRQDAVAQRVRDRIGWFTSSYDHYVRMPPLRVGKPGDSRPADRLPVAWVQSLDGIEQHIHATAGTLPQPVTSNDAGFQVAVSASSANGGLAVGDHFLLVDNFDDCERHPPRMGQPPDPPCTPHTSVVRAVPAVVTGFIAPNQDTDPFWPVGTEPFFAGRPPYDGAPSGAAIFVPAASMDSAFGSLFPDYYASQQWFAYADVSRLTRQNYKRAQAELAALNDDLLGDGLLTTSTVRGALESFNLSLSYDQAPLLILLLQITGIALFYVGFVAAMAVERQQPEIALLRSRGASARQVLLVYVVEGLGLAVPATLVGPFLGVAYTRLLGYTPIFRPVTGGAPIPTVIMPSTFALSALGAFLGVLALLLPALIAARFTGVTFRRRVGRPQPSIVQRYFLDYALLAICGVLLWELNASGTVFRPGTAGGLSSDPLLLLAPAMLTLGLAVLILRAYPLVLRAAARLVSAGRGVATVLALRQMTRNPAQYTRLGLLLMMGVALGAFAASYSDTTNRSFRERSLYQAGVELRGAIPEGVVTGDTAADTDKALASLPGVAQASSAVRTGADVASGGSSRLQVQLLGLDPAAGRTMLWYRQGLSHDSLGALMSDLGPPEGQIGIPIEGQPDEFSLWVNPAAQHAGLTAWVRIREANGHYEMYELGQLDFTGWRQLSVKLETSNNRPAYPVSLVSIVLTQGAITVSGSGDDIYFDDFAFSTAGGAPQVVEDFENRLVWSAGPLAASDQDEAVSTTDQHHGGTHALRYTLRPGVSADSRGFYVSDPFVPLPAIISRGFASQTGARAGNTIKLLVVGRVVPIRVQAIADLFPTLDPANGPFVIVNRSHLLEWLPRMGSAPLDQVNEVWVQPAPGANRPTLLRSLTARPFQIGQLFDAGASTRQDKNDPLVAAGGSGILLVSFIAALALIAGAFIVSLYTAVARRRVEFAVMKALGLGRGRVIAMLGFEYAVVSAMGAAAGLLLGLIISRIMLSFLEVTDTGNKVVPPFVLVTNWSMIAAAMAMLALIVAAAIAIAARAYTAGSDSAALRITE